MLKIAIIIGSTRPGRKAEAVAHWVYDIAQQRGDARFEVVDVQAFDLPLLDEPAPPAMGQYSQPHTQAWAAKIAAFDAYVFVTPEYNHGPSGALKNAIDYLYREWNNKAAGFVGYGSAGGTRAVEQLRLILAELQVATVRNQVALSLYADFENFTIFKPDPRHAASVNAMLDEVIDFINCERLTMPGITTDGGYAEMMIAEAHAVVSIPEEMTAVDAAPLLCAGVTTYNALRNVALRAGDLVAIQGLGGLGHLGVQFARRMGFRTVAIARGADKQPLATDLGAHIYIDSMAEDPASALQRLGGAAGILATAASASSMGPLLAGLRPRGQLIVVGASAEPIQVNGSHLIFGGRSIKGALAGTAADIADALAFSTLQGVRPMIEECPLDKATDAYARMMSGHARFRVVLTAGQQRRTSGAFPNMTTITTKDGTQIYYKDSGTGRPVVFSHSWPLSADAWEDQMLFLASHGYRCIAHDRRGHGRSSQPWSGNDMDT